MTYFLHIFRYSFRCHMVTFLIYIAVMNVNAADIPLQILFAINSSGLWNATMQRPVSPLNAEISFFSGLWTCGSKFVKQ